MRKQRKSASRSCFLCHQHLLADLILLHGPLLSGEHASPRYKAIIKTHNGDRSRTTLSALMSMFSASTFHALAAPGPVGRMAERTVELNFLTAWHCSSV